MDRELLYRFFKGNASVEEMKEVREWAESSDENRMAFRRERKLFDAMLVVGYSKPTSMHNHKKYSVFKEFMKMAAIVIVTFGVTAILFSIGKNKDMGMHIITVPPGQRVNLALPDGSKIWLNAGTTMQYPISFMANKREVILNGEAYFEVAKNEKAPFIVSTPNHSAIRVLGTRFNVKAYKENEEITTTLFEGKVEFEYKDRDNKSKNIGLIPGQKLVYNSTEDITKLYAVSGENESSWKDGKIEFLHYSLREALDVLSLQFNVDFVIGPNVAADDSFSGKFINKTLEQILDYFKVSCGINWRYLKKTTDEDSKQIIEIYN